jgi:co-chaperonin GroES (HSP10)
MKSPLYFIIRPLRNQEYINKLESGLIVNTSIEDHTYTQRMAVVIMTPIDYKGEIKEGDTIVVQHNTFRTQYDNQGFPRPSMYKITENLYYIEESLIYGIIYNDSELKALDPFCFVTPFDEDTKFEGTIEVEREGKLYATPKTLIEQGFKDGDVVFFKRDSEYEFNIHNTRLYLMNHNRILCKV